MTDLATADDVQVRLGRELTTAETARITPLLADASASVRNYTGQDFTAATTTARLRVKNGIIVLPQRPVTAVTAVVTTTGSPLLYLWDGFEAVITSVNLPDTWAWEPFTISPNGLTAADVTYTHGYNPIPDDVIGVVCSITMRALGRDPLDAGVTSETIQGYSYTLGSAGAAGGFGMLQPERDVLDNYRRNVGRVNTMPL